MTEEINKQYIWVSMHLNKTIEACHVHVFMYFVYTGKCVFVPRLFRQAQNMFIYVYSYISILNFVVLLNNGSFPYVQLKSIICPAQYDTKCFQWIKQEDYNENLKFL